MAAQPSKPGPAVTVEKDVSWFASHRKALIAYAGLVLSAASLAFPHEHWISVAVAAATAIGVHSIPNAGK